MRVIGKNILLLKIEKELQKVNGLIIPESIHCAPKQYKVIAVGNEVKEIKLNDVVAVSQYGGYEVVHDNIPYSVVKEEDILVIFQDANI